MYEKLENVTLKSGEHCFEMNWSGGLMIVQRVQGLRD